MSDEVRSNPVPIPAAEDQTSDSVDGPKSERSGVSRSDGKADVSAELVTPPEPPIPISIEFDSPASEPLSSEPLSSESLPDEAGWDSESPEGSGPPPASSEKSSPRSERPAPPSQRMGSNTLRVGAATAPVKPLPSPDAPVPPPAVPVANISIGNADLTAPSVPERRPSDPVPLVVPRLTPVQNRVSSLPPGLVEPKRIIEVLGSNVPVLGSAFQEEAIEDLDDSEAYEVAETPLPDAVSFQPEPDLELDVVVDGFGPEDSADQPSRDGDLRALVNASEADSASAPLEANGALLTSSFAESAPGERSVDVRAKAPPNKRRRPPPPSTRLPERPKPPDPQVGRKWWEEMFSEEFLRAIPILSPRQLEREVRFIDEGLSVARGGRILDLGCGAGQHAVELAARGYDLVGFDLSQSQLDWAGGLAQERGQRLQFTHGDMRDLNYNESFDAVYSWNTSFGFFEEDKNFDVAQRVFKALRPGGRFLLDVVNRDFIVAQQPGQTWFEGDGCVCIDDVSIDFITSRMKCKRTLMLTTGKNRECSYSVRIYGLHELGKMLHDVGFKVLTVSGRPEMPGVFFGATSPRIIILAAKPTGGTIPG
jgi:SAM-dependent methyltransferase